MLEKTLQKNCLDFCQKNGILAVKVDSTSSRGWPDLTVITPAGRVLFIELKTETGKLSALQRRMINKIKANKGEVYVVRSIEQFRAVVAAEPTDPAASGCG